MYVYTCTYTHAHTLRCHELPCAPQSSARRCHGIYDYVATISRRSRPSELCATYAAYMYIDIYTYIHAAVSNFDHSQSKTSKSCETSQTIPRSLVCVHSHLHTQSAFQSWYALNLSSHMHVCFYVCVCVC